ncbi:hypothetical protein GCM10010411_74030 [Actinomadura fulvescens]|uniref:Uncharacterized protein n=1 Tax=Actinomadura fulvescens TaxID=46160 RepID=A0ABN3QH28_9ACTN
MTATKSAPQGAKEKAFRRLADRAEAAARQAWMDYDGPTGWSGFAWLEIPARTEFARWLAGTGRARRDKEEPGITIEAGNADLMEWAGGDASLYQCVNRRTAWASAFAQVLRDGDLADVRVRTRLD